MKYEFKNPKGLIEDITLNNTSKDLTEFFISKNFNNLTKPIVLINEGLEVERIEKNFKFLNPSLKIIIIEEPLELYNFSAINLHETAKRNRNINKILTQKFDVLIIDYKILLKKLPSKEFFMQKLHLKIGEKFGHQNLINSLFEYGFLRCENVFEFGEFAVRGFIIDVGTLDGFVRIEFDGEVVTSICIFNIETQRKNTNNFLQEIEIFRIKDIVLNAEILANVKKHAFNLGFEFKQNFLTELQGFFNLSLHNFLPLFYENLECIVDFLPKEKTLITNENLKTTLEFFIQNLSKIEELYRKEGRDVLPLQANLWGLEEIMKKLSPAIVFSGFNREV